MSEIATEQFGYLDGDVIVPVTGTLELVLRAAFGRKLYKRTVTGSNARFDGGLLDGAEIRMRGGMPSGERVIGDWVELGRRSR